MSKQSFRKGDKVTFIGNWDSKGTVFYVRAIVHSCGKKQMVLIDEQTGKVMGRHYSPNIGSVVVTKGVGYVLPGGTFPRMSRKESEETGLKIAGAIQEFERERLAHYLASGADDKLYAAAIQKQMESLHPLDVIDRTGCH